MMRRFLTSTIVLCLAAHAVVVDRIAVIVEGHAIKDSDIERTIRITSFLNHEQARFDAASRKTTASRLIDQELIRVQVRSGDYRAASEKDVESLLAKTSTDAALARYGIAEEELKRSLLWQLTVLHFIEDRFRPAVMVTEQQIEDYYAAHRAELEAANPEANTLEDLRRSVEDTLAGGQVNQLFEQWLTQARTEAHVEYREVELQ